MRRTVLAKIASVSLLLAAVACGDDPMAPRAVAIKPIDVGPSEVVAQVGTLVSLAPLSGFGAGGVTAINNRRETAGWNYTTGTAYHAFLRSADGSTISDLGTLGGTGSIALAMNDSSSVVGFSYVSTGVYHAFVSRLVAGSRVMTDLATVGGTRGAAYGINAAGTVVGFATNAAGKQFAVRWAPPLYTPDTLGSLVGGGASFAYAINDAGTIAGWSTNSTGTIRALKWTVLKVRTDLGALNGATGSSTARSINNNGDIVGWSTTASGVYHAFKFLSGGAMADLGTTSGPSYAFDISNSGQVTGWAQPSAGNEQALLWNGGTTTDLGTTSTSTWAKAYAMNDSGMVVGTSGDQATVWFLNTNRAPTAAFSSLAHSKVNQTPEDFDASTSSDPDGDQLTYTWSFADGSATVTTASKTISHLYTTTGFFNVKLTVTDWRGATNTLIQTIHIN